MIKVKETWLKFKIAKWALTSIGFLITLFLSFNYYDDQKKRVKNDTIIKTERAIVRLESRIKIYETLITQTEAFFITLQKVDYKSFKSYYQNLKNLSRFHGFQGLGFTRYIPEEKRPTFLKEIREEIPNFAIWPFSKKSEYLPITYLEPQGVFSETAIGFDQSTDPKRELAFTTSLLTGETTMTGMIRFIKEKTEPSNSMGFLLVRPLFSENDNNVTDKKNLIGFIFAPFLYFDFFKHGWEDFVEDFSFHVYEEKEDDKRELIYSSNGEVTTGYYIENEMILFGQKFHVYFYPKEKNNNHLQISLIIILVGFSITLLVLKVLNDTIKRAEESTRNEIYLEESLKSRDEFISIASHELKTPLTSLKLRAQISKRKILNNNVTKKDLNDFSTEIEKQVIRLERLVNDILDISRIRTGNFSLVPENFNFSSLIEEVILRMGHQFTEQNIPKLILPKPDIEVYWDKLRIEQVITNLLTNAIKYGKNAPITVEVQDKRGDVLFMVKDQGIGIAPQFRETIFNRFDRAGISANEISGLGLGLYITYKIVTSHQGRIWVDSHLGEGSTFSIKIPKYPRF